LLREALGIFRERYGMKPELAAQANHWLGAARLAHGCYSEAETLLLPSIEPLLAPTAAMSAAERRTAVAHVVELYQSWGKSDQATAWRQKLEALAPKTISKAQ
jgi:hypothetical protein